MKSRIANSIILTALLLCLCPLAMADEPADAPITWASVEIYPDADVFLCGGKYWSNWKVDVWSTNASEISFATGPVVKGIRFGIGAGSLKTDDGFNGLGFVNVDVGFTLNVGKLTWSSYNCNQNGQNGVSDFILARQWFSYGTLPVGLIGHNRQCGEGDWELYWGPYAALGDMGGLKNNRLCITFNLNPTDQTGDVWTAWVFDL